MAVQIMAENRRTTSASEPLCSVVISTRDRPSTLLSCLQSIRTQGEPDLEIVIVDSAPQFNDSRAVAARIGARYVLVDRPGLSLARNRGASAATGEILIFLDDDLTLQTGCIRALTDEFVDPRTMAVGGRILLLGGDDEARAAFEAFGGFDPGPERRVVDRDTNSWFELSNFGGLGSGAMLAVRRRVFDSWSGFDERLGRGAPLNGGEELLAYFSLIDLGNRVVYTPKAVAWHPAPASIAELRERLVSAAEAATAYLTLLFIEYPCYRREAARYVWQALHGEPREWRSRPAANRHAVLSRSREWGARIMGPLQYVGMRFRTRMSRF